MKTLSKQTGTILERITIRIEEMEKRILGNEGTIKKIDLPVNENVN